MVEIVPDLVDRDRWCETPALRGPAGKPTYDYRQLGTTVHKTANFLSHFGVHPRAKIGVVPGPGGAPILTTLAASILGASVRFGVLDADTAVILAPASVFETNRLSLPVGTTGIVFGGSSSDPRMHQFGRGIWSENPACPVAPAVDKSSPLLDTGNRPYMQGELLAAANTVRKRVGLATGDVVIHPRPVDSPSLIVLGVLAPLSGMATIEMADDGDADSDGPVRIEFSSGDVETIDPAEVAIPNH